MAKPDLGKSAFKNGNANIDYVCKTLFKCYTLRNMSSSKSNGECIPAAGSQ